MADPRKPPGLESEEIDMSVLRGDFNRHDPEVPPPLPPKQNRKDPSCRPKQTWTDPSCRPKQPLGLPSRPSGRIPEGQTHCSRRRGGRKTGKVPSRPPDQNLGLPSRSPEQSPDPSCSSRQRNGRRNWKVPSRHTEESLGLPPRPPEQAPSEPPLPSEQSPDPSHRSRQGNGERTWKVPSRHTEESLGLPPRPPEQAPDEPSVTLILPKQRDGRMAGVYRHRLREEDLVKLPLNPMYGADVDLPSGPDAQQTTPKQVVGATPADMAASGGQADDSPPADIPGPALNRDAHSARSAPTTQRPGRTTDGAQPAAAATHVYEDGDTFRGLGQPLNRNVLGAPTLPKTPRPGRTTDGAQPAAAATHTYENGDEFRQGFGQPLNRDDDAPPVPSSPRPGGPPGGAKPLPSWPQMLRNPQAILSQLQPNAMYNSNANYQPPVAAQESRTIWGRLRDRLSPRLLICAAVSSVALVTVMIVVPVLLTHLNSQPGNHDSPATTTTGRTTTGSTVWQSSAVLTRTDVIKATTTAGRTTAGRTAWQSSAVLMKTDHVTPAGVIKVSPAHGRGPSHAITAVMEAAGPKPINKPVSTTTEGTGNKKHIVTFGDESGAGKLQGARGVAVSPDNKIWVADQYKVRLQVYSMEGAYLYQFPQGAPGLGYPSKTPSDVSIDRDGHLWVLMDGYPAGPDSVVQFGRDGQLKANFDLPDNVPRGVHRGMAVGLHNNHLFVTWSDGHSGGVQAFKPDGKLLWDGQRRMKSPISVTVDGEGNIFISDYGRHVIYKFRETGRYVSRFGGPGVSGGRLNHPQGICVDSSGHILVVDEGNQRVVMYTSLGRYVRNIAVRA